MDKLFQFDDYISVTVTGENNGNDVKKWYPKSSDKSTYFILSDTLSEAYAILPLSKVSRP